MPWLTAPGASPCALVPVPGYLFLCLGPFPYGCLFLCPSHADPALPCSDSRPCSHSSTCGPETCLWTTPGLCGVPQRLRGADFLFPASFTFPFLTYTSASCSLPGSIPQLPAQSAQHPPSTIMLQLLSREFQRASVACPQLTHVLQVLLHGNRYDTFVLAASAYLTKAQPCML